MSHDRIEVIGARTHNLQNVDAVLPRRTITAVTGVSGSGKTSLVFDTVAAEAQRELNETFAAFVRNRLPTPRRPDVDRITGLSPVVVVDQRRLGGNARSTVGTITDIAPSLRLLFSRVGEPAIGESGAFSFNEPAGMCPRCSGLGEVVTPQPARLVDLDRSLDQGAILLPGFGNKPGAKRYWYRQWAGSGLFDVGAPLRSWSSDALDALLHGRPAAERLGVPVPRDYEGLVEHFERIYLRGDGEAGERKQAAIRRFAGAARCPDCDGARLNERARSVRVAGHTITECTATEVADLVDVVRSLEAPAPVSEALVGALDALVEIGLGYLTLDRPTGTLSGGESQRIKMVRHLGSSLTEMLYVFDEPSIGLHPADVERLTGLLRALRDAGNTVLVVEHDPDVLAIADHVVDLGPGGGTDGGRIVFSGPVSELATADTATGRAFGRRLTTPTRRRRPTGTLPIRGAARHNLAGLDVDLSRGVMTALTGVAGSGKSSLVDVLIEQHPDAVVVDQRAVSSGRRSLIATYTGIADEIRARFARASGLPASSFSPNAAGSCPECRGLGVVYLDLAFLDAVVSTCPTCDGRRFTDEVLAHTVDGRSIADVLDLSIEEARSALADLPTTRAVLCALAEVGLGHLAIGRPTSSLSGGENQRVKLAMELHRVPRDGVYVLDEPTTGLHLDDVDRLLGILDRLVEVGNTVVVVEHHLDVIAHADHVVDLGPGAGHHGGRVVASGTPEELADDDRSVTGRHLRRHRAGQVAP